MRSKYFIVQTFFLSCLLSNFCLAQENIAIDSWRTHLSYNSITTVTTNGSTVYAGSSNAFFSYDIESNSFKKLSKTDGLSNTSIEKVLLHPTENILVIVYSDAMVDIALNGKIFPISTLKEAAINGSKKINHIQLTASKAYLSCNFGLVLIDIKKHEVREVYRNIGPLASEIEIYASAIADGKIFLASEQGVMEAQLSDNINLMDFNNWSTHGTEKNIPEGSVQTVTSHQNKIYAGINNEGVFKLVNTAWEKLTIPSSGNIRSITSSEVLSICQDSSVYLLDETDNYTVKNLKNIEQPTEAYQFENIIWIADQQNGLLKVAGNTSEILIPSGPASNSFFKLTSFDDKIAGVPGGYNSFSEPTGNPGTVSIFENGFWTNYLPEPTGDVTIPLLKDFTQLVYNPVDKTFYISSFQDGILAIKSDNSTEIFNQANAPLEVNTQNGKLSLPSLAFDFEGNLWVANYGAEENSLHKKNPNGSQWQSYPLESPRAKLPLEILIDFNNYKWLRLDPSEGGGIVIFDDLTGQERFLSSEAGNGGLPDARVRTMVMDKEGSIWTGTDKGVAVFFSSSFFGEDVDATLPIFDNRPLLKDQKINCIEVDGGNRKWIGTDNGLWLFNADGTEIIKFFSTGNSPLSSNKILDIEIIGKTGEVFIATDNGLISYRSNATEAEDFHSDVKVFPNPVFPGYSGSIAMSGLARDSNVKITDTSGKLVYQAIAAGGTATWDLQTLDRKRAKPGVYLIFSSSEDGEDNLVSKFVLIE